LVLGAESEIHEKSGSIFSLSVSDDLKDSLRDSVTVLQLDDFDHLAFDSCVFESYSPLDCALLLRAKLNDVEAAIVRAKNQILTGERNDQVGAGVLSLDAASSGTNRRLVQWLIVERAQVVSAAPGTELSLSRCHPD
jgi:hypothetical protein